MLCRSAAGGPGYTGASYTSPRKGSKSHCARGTSRQQGKKEGGGTLNSNDVSALQEISRKDWRGDVGAQREFISTTGVIHRC